MNLFPDRYWPVREALVLNSSLTVPRHHDLAAVLPRSGPDVDDVVGGADGLLVVFHHDDRVADVPQPDKGVDQLAVVSLV